MDASLEWITALSFFFTGAGGDRGRDCELFVGIWINHRGIRGLASPIFQQCGLGGRG